MATSGATTNHHAVSQVVLRRWTDVSHQLVRYSLVHSQGRLTGTRRFGAEDRVHPDDPELFERLWKGVEDRLPGAFLAVDGGTALEDPLVVDVLRACLAMHMARSLDLAVVHDAAFAAARQQTISGLVERLHGDPRVLASFLERHYPLVPAGPEALAYEARFVAERIVAESEDAIEASAFRAERMVELYAEAARRVAGAGIELAVADEGEFLIGDAPAQALRAGASGVGPKGGVPWGGASTIFMPIGPRHLVAVGRDTGWLHLDADAVEQLNRAQIAAAHKVVAWRTTADFRGLVATVRPPAR